jgi:hypothetical protein
LCTGRDGVFDPDTGGGGGGGGQGRSDLASGQNQLLGRAKQGHGASGSAPALQDDPYHPNEVNKRPSEWKTSMRLLIQRPLPMNLDIHDVFHHKERHLTVMDRKCFLMVLTTLHLTLTGITSRTDGKNLIDDLIVLAHTPPT